MSKAQLKTRRPEATSPTSSAPASHDVGESNSARAAELLFNRQEIEGKTSSSRMRGDLEWMRGWLEEGPERPGAVDEGRLEDSASGERTVGPLRAAGEVSGALDEHGPRGEAEATLEADLGDVQAGFTGTVAGDREGVAADGSVHATHEAEVLGLDAKTSVKRGLRDGKTEVETGLAHTGTTGDLEHDAGVTLNADNKGKAGAKAKASIRRTDQLGDWSTTSGGTAEADEKGARAGLSVSAKKGNTTAKGSLSTDGTIAAEIGGKEKDELIEAQRAFGEHTTAKARALGGELGASLGARRTKGGVKVDAKAEAALTLAEGEVKGEHEVARVNQETVGIGGRLHGAGEARATATGSAQNRSDGASVEGKLKLFAGAKASAELDTTLNWDRRNYAELLRDYADNLPGDLDDALLDKLPESFWDRAAKVLFGVGKTQLLRVGVGVDARAGAGAEAGGKLSAKGNLIEAEADAGAALGVGGGLKFRGGLNPLDLLRRAAVFGMHRVNEAVGTAEGWVRGLRGVPSP